MDEINTLTKEAIEICINEYNKKENKQKIEKEILDPIVNYIGQQLWPYVISVSVLLFLVFILIFYIAYKSSQIVSVSSSMKRD